MPIDILSYNCHLAATQRYHLQTDLKLYTFDIRMNKKETHNAI